MNFSTEITEHIDENYWDKNLLQNNSSTIYQSYNWARLYKDVFESQPIFILVKNLTNEIVGQLLLFIHNDYNWANANPLLKKIGTKFKIGKTLLWMYGPIINDQNNCSIINQEIVNAIQKIAHKNQIMMIRGASSPLSNLNNDAIFENNNFQVKHWGTHIINLEKNPDELFAQLNKKTRYDIRKGEKNNLEFEVSDDRSVLEEYIELKHKEREGKGQRTTRIPLFNEKYWVYLHNNNHLKLFVVRHNDQLVGGILGITFNGNIVQHGVLNIKNELSAGPYLTWNAIKWCIQNKFRIFDMGGFNPFPDSNKERSIDFYKAKWGGKEVRYSLYTKILDKTKFSISTALLHPERVTKKVSKILKRR